METAQRSLITVVIDGKSYGVWDTITGLNTTSDPTLRRPGGMGPKRSSAALPDYDDVQVGRQWDLPRDWEASRTIGARVGRALGSVTEQPLDENGAPWGKPKVRSGRLIASDDGEGDSDSNDPRMWQVTFRITSSA